MERGRGAAEVSEGSLRRLNLESMLERMDERSGASYRSAAVRSVTAVCVVSDNV